MTKKLFRTECSHRLVYSGVGPALPRTPRSHRYALASSVTLVVALASIITFGSYARRERATGVLVPASGIVQLTAPISGTVTKTYLLEWQAVEKNSPILEISTERISTGSGETSKAILSLLHTDRERLMNEINSVKALARADMKGLGIDAKHARNTVLRISDQITLQRQQVSRKKQLVDRMAPLVAKGYVSFLQLEETNSQLFAAEQELVLLDRQKIEAEQKLSTIDIGKARHPFQLASRLRELERALATNHKETVKADAEKSGVLRATSAGTVSNLSVKKGQSVTSSQVVGSLVPKDGVLSAQILADSKAIGFVHPGTRVSLRLNAFPYQKFGSIQGIVSAVSASAMTPQEASALLGNIQVGAHPLYRIDVALPDQFITANGETKRLRAGMEIEADLILDRRRLIEWMLEPLIGVAKRTKSEHQ